MPASATSENQLEINNILHSLSVFGYCVDTYNRNDNNVFVIDIYKKHWFIKCKIASIEFSPRFRIAIISDQDLHDTETIESLVKHIMDRVIFTRNKLKKGRT